MFRWNQNGKSKEESKLLKHVTQNAVTFHAQEIISLLLQCKSIDWSLCNRQHCEVQRLITNYKHFVIINK